DRDEPGHGCSYGNSGAISPSSVAPLAMPGVLRSVPGMLLDAASPLRLPLAYLPRALPWLAAFVASARPARVAAAAERLAALHAHAVERHVALAHEVGVPELVARRGHLHVYPDVGALARDAAAWRLRKNHGFAVERVDRAGIDNLEPGIGPRYRVGMYLADHATVLNPLRYVQAIVRAFAAHGGEVRRSDVQALLADPEGGWEMVTDAGASRWASIVVATGAWSCRLLDPLGVHVPLESQRGYHVQFRGASPVSRTVVLADRKIFLAPMEDGLRVGGTVEIAGLVAPPDPRRAEILRRVALDTFSGLDAGGATTWMGHRPCLPDSVPIVGPVEGRAGLYLALGHGHLGLTDAPHTAERIADALAFASRAPDGRGETD
ncbi:MAG: FAD-dependent oxidoreductase, partial [Casimicrobiaceae bacterium]